MIIIDIECENCGTFFENKIEREISIKCIKCKKIMGTVHPDWLFQEPCPVCKNLEYYRRKDFNQLLGILVIIIGAILAISISYIFLLIFALIDLLLMKIIPDVGVCYGCLTEFRNISNVKSLSIFNHHKAELLQK